MVVSEFTSAAATHRPLEEEEVVGVHGEVARERKVARADERVVDRHRAVYAGVQAEGVGAQPIWRVRLVAEGEGKPGAQHGSRSVSETACWAGVVMAAVALEPCRCGRRGLGQQEGVQVAKMRSI